MNDTLTITPRALCLFFSSLLPLFGCDNFGQRASCLIKVGEQVQECRNFATYGVEAQSDLDEQQTYCTQHSGQWTVDEECSSTGAVGGCYYFRSRRETDLRATYWYFSGEASEIEASCVQGGGSPRTPSS